MFHETFGHLGEGQEKESGRPLIRHLSIFLGLFKDNYDHSSKIYLVMNIMQIVYKNRWSIQLYMYIRGELYRVDDRDSNNTKF